MTHFCKKCNNVLLNTKIIDGKRRYLNKRSYCLECSPYKVGRRCWTDDQLIEIVKTSKSLSDILRGLNLEARGSNFSSIKKHISRLNIDTSHLDGRAEAIKKLHAGKIKAHEEVFCENSNVSQYTLRRRLLQQPSVKYECANCDYIKIDDDGVATYMGMVIKLQTDHINGNSSDNRLENLRWLCPNCHSQTSNWGTKNFKERFPEKILPKLSFDRTCKECESNFQTSDESQLYCSSPCRNRAKRITEWPSKELLSKLVWEISTEQIAKRYNVSGNTVKKWCRHYDIEKPGRGYWAKRYAEKKTNNAE